jgi:tetratricopeptide (TPR) repeat protein
MKTIRFITLMTLILLAFNAFSQTLKSPKANDNSKSSNPPNSLQDKDFEAVKTGIAGILTDKVEILDKKKLLTIAPRDVTFTDDKIVMKSKEQTMVINFTDFIDDNITSPGYRKAKIILHLDNFEFISNGWVTSNLKRFEELKKYLIFIQNQARKKRYESQLVLFQPIAAQYRELNIKPPVTEEQRKFIVQANAFNEQKTYEKAIELYNKAVAVNQTSYPAGYSNLALLSAQINNFDAAIFYMKKYLMLEPEASDARSAQDKIYEWEAHIAK